MRKRSVAVVAFAVVVLGLGATWRSLVRRSASEQRHKPVAIAPAPEGSRDAAKAPAGTDGRGAIKPLPPDLSESKKALARHLKKALTPKMVGFAAAGIPNSLYNLRFGDDPSFRNLVKDAQALLGDEFSPAVRGLLDEFQSPAYRSVLLLMLGTAGAEDAIPVMKSMLAEGQDQTLMCAAAYSLGILRNDDAFRFLSGYYATLRTQLAGGDLKTLVGVVESGLAANGEKALPVLLDAARAELAAALATDGTPDPEANLTGFGDRWLSFLRVDTVSPRLRELIEHEADPRIRFTLLAGLAKNKIPETYQYLAQLSADTKDPNLQAHLLQAVAGTVFGGDEGVSRSPGPIRDSLGRMLQALGPLANKEHGSAGTLIALACRLDSDVSRQWLDGYLKQDLGALYGEHAPEFRRTLAFSLAAMKSGEAVLADLLKGVPDAGERARLVAQYYRNLSYDRPLKDPEQIRLLAGVLGKPDQENPDFGFVLTALRKSDVEKDVVLGAFRKAYDDSPPAWRVKILDAAGALGPEARPFLDGILKGENGLVMKVEAARQLLRLSPGEEVRERLDASLSAVLSPVEKVSGDVLYAVGRNAFVYADLVREYYSRFGTEADLRTLESIPNLITFDRRVPESWADTYRARLTTQCQEARDVILMRMQTK